MLAHTTSETKNCIVFQHGNNLYIDNLTPDDASNALDRTLMNTYMLQYEDTLGIHVTFDNIVKIRSLENALRQITDLPRQLRELHVMNARCVAIEVPNYLFNQLEVLSIINSNLQQIPPEVVWCTRLRALTLSHAAIRNFNLEFLPPALLQLNLSFNYIGQEPDSIFNYLICMTDNFMFRADFSYNHIATENLPSEFTRKHNLVIQKSYVHRAVCRAADANIRQLVRQAGQVEQPVGPKILGMQSVHLSSINKSVMESIKAIQSSLSTEQQEQLKQSQRTKMEKEIEILELPYENHQELIEWIHLSTVHSIVKLTYCDLLAMIWMIHDTSLLPNTTTSDLQKRLKEEIIDSHKMCFTGRFNRLVNACVGIVKGVHVGLSINEEIQLTTKQIITKYNEPIESDEDENDVLKQFIQKANAFQVAINEFDEMVERFTKEEQTEANIPSWKDALNDLSPTPFLFNSLYLIEWDMKAFHKETGEHVGTFDTTSCTIIH